MHFRPFPVLTIIAIPALAALISLGVWQLQRAQWKAGLIEQFERASNAPPLPSSLLSVAMARLRGGSCRLAMWTGISDAYPSIRMFGQSATGQPGWRLFSSVSAPACAGDGVLLAELGFEPMPQDYLPPEAPGRKDKLPPFHMARARNVCARQRCRRPMTGTGSMRPRSRKRSEMPKINDRFYLAIMPESLPVHLIPHAPSNPHRLCGHLVRDSDRTGRDIRRLPRAGWPPALPQTGSASGMKYVSTRGNAAPVDFVSASLMGLAPDGGLFSPETFPQIERPSPDGHLCRDGDAQFSPPSPGTAFPKTPSAAWRNAPTPPSPTSRWRRWWRSARAAG